MPDDLAPSSRAPRAAAAVAAPAPAPKPAKASVPALYPTFCWPASPTYNSWVKMSAVDVMQLRRERQFEAHPRVWFYNNHPVRFVRLVGIVTSWTPSDSSSHPYISPDTTPLQRPQHQHNQQQRPHVFTLDDGSGASLDIVIWPRDRAELSQKIARFPGDLIRLGPLDFKQHVGRSVSGDLVDLDCVALGETVKVKGWVGEYRGEKQVLLERVQRVGGSTGAGGAGRTTASDSAMEIKEWERLAEFQTRVLAKPWVLSKEEVDGLRRRERRARVRETRKAQKRAVDALDPSFRQGQEVDGGKENGQVQVQRQELGRVGGEREDGSRYRVKIVKNARVAA